MGEGDWGGATGESVRLGVGGDWAGVAVVSGRCGIGNCGERGRRRLLCRAVVIFCGRVHSWGDEGVRPPDVQR